MLVRVRERVRAQVRPGRARPWLDGGVLNVWVPTANRSSATHVETKEQHDCKAKERAQR
jgi:hypothetical protein